MLDAGLRLTEVVNLTVEDLGEDDTLRIFGAARFTTTDFLSLLPGPSVSLPLFVRLLMRFTTSSLFVAGTKKSNKLMDIVLTLSRFEAEQTG